MDDWNGDRGSSWSGYRQETVGSSVSSSRSGTIASRLSTASASSGSCFPTFLMEVAMHFDSLGINNMDDWEEREPDEENNRSLVQEFFSAPSVNCSIKVGDMSLVDRWLKDLGVGWVLHLDDGPSVVKKLPKDRDLLQSWVSAIDQMALDLSFTRPLFPDRGSVILPGICKEEGEHVAEKYIPDRYHLALFIQETMLKMLAFIDFAVTWDRWAGVPDSVVLIMRPPYGKLVNQLMVHDALLDASNKILTLFDAPTSVGVRRIHNEMAVLLSAYKSKLGEAIRSTMEKIRKMLMEDSYDSPSPNPQGSSDIHKLTQSVMTYIDLLQNSSLLVNAAIQGHVPWTENTEPVESVIVEMTASLQEKLLNISESFSDQGLKFLFLLNNSYKIQDSIQFDYLQAVDDLTNKIEGYMERYLQLSWAPLLSCLFNPTPLCLGKIYSPLSKFESEFQKIYTTQKQWKVPNPELRGRLREVITEKIIPGYTEYIEDKQVTNLKISLKELEEMLQELFEG